MNVVFITGGASGIGLAVAALLQQRGAALALMDLSETALQAARATLAGGEVLTIAGDVTRPDDCERAVAQTVARYGGIDTVWANAGIAELGPLRHVDLAAWTRIVQVNLFGVMHAARAALPSVIARRGQIAVSASAASFAHAPAMSAYAASKAAVEAMCDCWRIELAHHGVAVTCIHPLWVTTPMIDRVRDDASFQRLRAAMVGPLSRDVPIETAAPLIATGIASRARRVFVPGWARWLFALRALLHTRPAELDQLKAAPELERLWQDEQAGGAG